MIRFLIILFAALIMYAAGRFVFFRAEHKIFQMICYGVATILVVLFVYISALALFIN